MVLLLSMTGLFAQKPGASAQKPGVNTALVLIDIQEFYFDTTKMPLVGNEKAALEAAHILKYFRDNHMLVVHVRHKGGGDIHPLVQPIEGEKVIEKQQVNGFLGTDLYDYLKQNGISKLVLAGMQTHMCLEGTTRAASDFGFKCTVISDACATRDLKYGDRIVKAEDVHLSTLATLETYANVITTDEFLKMNK